MDIRIWGLSRVASVPIAEYAKVTNISSQTFVTGDSDIQIGTIIGQTNGGHNNIAIGKNSLLNANGTSRNISIGEDSMKDNAGGSTNISIGSLSLSNNTSGNSNVSIGYANSIFNETGSRNVNIGEYSGYNNESGSNNVNIGYRANYQNQGSSSVNHSNVTTLGANTLINGISITNSTAIGANSIVTTSNTIQLGDSNVTQINTSGVVSATDFILSGDSVGNILGSLSSTESDIASLSSQVNALLAAVDDLDIQTNSLSSTLSESNTSEIKSAQVVITSNDVVLFELGVLRFSWNNTYNTIQVKQSSTSEIIDNWFISGVIRSGGSDGEYTPTEKYIQKTNMTYGIGDDGGGNDFFYTNLE